MSRGCLSPALAQQPRAADATPQFLFRDVGAQAGVLPAAAGIRGHAAGWGDVDGDGWIDLYVATFDTGGPDSKRNLFFRNTRGSFQLDPNENVRISTRASAALFADLDNDADLDLYVSSMPAPAGSTLAAREGRTLLGCTLFRNDGAGRFTDISDGNGACPPAFGGRSAAVLDYDGDGLLDLLVGEDPLPGYNGSPTRASRLFRNTGGLRFEDATRAAGLPDGIPGYGVAAADVNNDTWPDLFIAANDGGNILFINDGRGRFREAPGARRTFAWKGAGGDNMICGVCFGDVNRDGFLDIVLGQHFEAPWKSPVPVRLYVNRGIADGLPTFQDVTDSAGLVPLPMKGPHVELQDFDNDGLADLYVSIVKFAADGRPAPLIFRNTGADATGLPHFREDVLAVNDFPTADDRATGRAGRLFQKVLEEKKIIYTAAGPSGDFDHDGRLDLFLASWFPEAPSLLLHNQTPGSHWLDVTLRGPPGVNRIGIGARVNVYRAGSAGDRASLLGSREIASGFGYASGQPAVAHFGLGEAQHVDVQVILPHDKGTLLEKNVTANQRLALGPQ